MDRGQIMRLHQLAEDIDRDIARSLWQEPQASSKRKKMRLNHDALIKAIHIVESAKCNKEATNG